MGKTINVFSPSAAFRAPSRNNKIQPAGRKLSGQSQLDFVMPSIPRMWCLQAVESEELLVEENQPGNGLCCFVAL